MGFHIINSKWYRLHWFSISDTTEERRLICKLDLLLIPYSFAVYVTKYIDQSNINNAYVGGMKEDLGFHGNELVHFQTMYIAGAVLGQLPFLFLLSRIPIHRTIPLLDVAWGVFTLLQYRATSYAELMAYRFLIGWFEAAYFPIMHFTFGSWYKSHEIARRAGFWYTAQTVGTLTAGLIQAAASSSLNGVHGLAGWRWMYIICAIVTIPIGLLGFLILPGTPDRPNCIFLKQHEIDLALERLHRAGHVTSDRLTCRTVRRIVSRKLFWALLVLDVFFWNGSTNVISGGFLLWLKSLKRYSYARVNTLGSISPALGIFYILLVSSVSDLLLGPAWAITLGHSWNILGLIILVIWNVPEGALWFAFLTTYSAVSMSSVVYSWMNSLLKSSPAERSFTLVFCNIIAQSTVAWTPLLVFKTTEAPRFTKGYSYVMGNAICLVLVAHAIQYYLKMQDRDASEGLVGLPNQSKTERSGSETSEKPTPSSLHENPSKASELPV